MWVRQATYIELRERAASRAATIEWLRQDVNRLNAELAALRAQVLGIPPTHVPFITRTESPTSDTTRKVSPKDDDGPSMEDLVKGNVSFEDMGDAAAGKAGVDWDPESGMVRYS